VIRDILLSVRIQPTEAKMAKLMTEREVFDSVDEGVMRKIHRDSSQQGAEYMYTCIHNEFEWAVF
jgi:hypothetical protein